MHPGLLLNQSNSTRSPTYRVGPSEAGLHAKDETRFINPAYVGKRLRVTWAPAERYERRGRLFTVTDVVMMDEDGREILRRRLTGTTSSGAAPIERRAEDAAATPGAAPVPEPPGYPTSEIGIVYRGLPKDVILERMRLFSGWPRKNIHTDDEVARAAGLPAPIASATQNMGHICELMLDIFGDEWLCTGSLILTFRRPIYAADVITSSAVITERETQDGVSRYNLDVQAVNQHGTPVTVGRAGGIYR